VLINPGMSDGTCEYCLAGEQPLCPRFGILGEHVPGTLAEHIVLPATNVRRVADDTDPVEGAAFTLSTLTAWRMLLSRARVTAGEHVLIWGIGGGVAQACLQIAKLHGAYVTVTSGSDAKLERALALGADATLNHRGVDVGKEMRARTQKRGVDVVPEQLRKRLDLAGEAEATIVLTRVAGHGTALLVRPF
jgi:NADPH:quinone reductase-like Zn-dependent oxidoreductase